MFSQKPSKKRSNDFTDGPDTESLLSEQAQEKLILDSRYERSKRNGGLNIFLHIAIISFYGIIAILLLLWSAKLHGTKCACENGAVYYNDIRVQKEELEKAGLKSVPLNDEKGGYFVTLDVYHTLHCVNHLRKSYYSDYYHNPNPVAQQREHFDHCIDLLRQTLMCHGDISMHPFEWIDGYRFPWPTEQTEHQCRNWDKLVAWSKEHSVSNLEGPILTHPTLGRGVRAGDAFVNLNELTQITGTSWRGDEPDWTTGAASGRN
ncbi:hypothetical protein G3M48_002199 [Beauveria asiatica]|uniref:Tat pathway signal sequence n=1 Tax=Beauveria asiatica TaxID=1069075 RepID=A0AAW0RXR4_9HYPO